MVQEATLHHSCPPPLSRRVAAAVFSTLFTANVNGDGASLCLVAYLGDPMRINYEMCPDCHTETIGWCGV